MCRLLILLLILTSSNGTVTLASKQIILRYLCRYVVHLSLCVIVYLLSLCCFSVCCGAIGEIDKAMSLLREVPTLIFMKDNRLETFVKRRVSLDL